MILQDEYKNEEEIGILQCGHEYHVCPLCKSKALAIG